ncbi:MAG: hypothetical protein K6A69_03380 [Lachnospiraceae bacterium]|nr:hypothetical protein [Lachnospiraceae bacterium]
MTKKRIILLVLIAACLITAGVLLYFKITLSVKESSAEKQLLSEYESVDSVSFLHKKNSDGRKNTIAVIDIKESMAEEDKEDLEGYLRDNVSEKIYIIYE